ncbi:MAG: hypothetical protein Q9170_007422 [Blastenia crenularia]
MEAPSKDEEAKSPLRIISSKENLKGFHWQVIGQMVERILEVMSDHKSLRKYKDLGIGFSFFNQAHPLQSDRSEVEQRRREAVNKSQIGRRETRVNRGLDATQTPTKTIMNPPQNADQYCVTWKGNSARPVFIEEYKAPHKLTHHFLSLLPDKNHQTRSKHSRDDADDDSPDDHGNNGGDESQGSSERSVSQDSPPKYKGSRAQNGNNQQGGHGSSTKHTQQPREYCTQACLAGMVRWLVIDKKCPNTALHPRNTTNPSLHLVKGLREFRTLVLAQLTKTLNTNITDLGVAGARGMLFRLMLASHRYVIVGKGTIDVFVPDLKHEGRIYSRLKSL